METVYIIIPVYNEADNLRPLVDALTPHLVGREKILLVDDASQDASPRIIQELSKAVPVITPILNEQHQGYASMLRQTFARVPAGQWIITVMADGCDDLTALRDLFRAAASGVDMVCASRYMRGGMRVGGSRLKAAGSRAVNLCLRNMLRLPCHDSTNSYKLFRRDMLDDITLESRGFDIFMELTLRASARGYRIIEIPTRWRERCQGQSHFGVWRDGMPYLWNAARWTFAPQRSSGRP
jgi:glycosyltransferase involved in cell wall biosynthesis